MRPKKSMNELEEDLRGSVLPGTAVPPHFRQKLRRDLQAQAAANQPQSLARVWLFAPVVLVVLVLVVFWVAWPKTAVDPITEIAITRPVPMPTVISAVPLAREEAIEIAITIAHEGVYEKPIGGRLVDDRVEAMTVTAVLEAYDVAVNRLGRFAIAEMGGSNIIFLEYPADTIWMVQLVGRWQPFGEAVDKIEPFHYVAVLIDSETRQIVGMGSSTRPFLQEPIVLAMADYPPQERPYDVEQGGGFWLVHAGSQLLAFATNVPYPPVPGEMPAPCTYVWNEPNKRFADPCSGDEWELDGTLYLIESTESSSSRNLDQYRVEVVDGNIAVHVDEITFGEVVEIEIQPTPISTIEQPSVLVSDTQNGVTASLLDVRNYRNEVVMTTMVQVGPEWEMRADAFLPGPSFVYDVSVRDAVGRPFTPTQVTGQLPIADPATGGLKQSAIYHFPGQLAEGMGVIVTSSIDLSNIHRIITLPLTWEGAGVGQSWLLDWQLPVGATEIYVKEVRWVRETADHQAQLQLHVVDSSPDELTIYCLHIAIADPWQETCANFDGEKVYTVTVPPDAPVVLHLRVGVEVGGFVLQWPTR